MAPVLSTVLFKDATVMGDAAAARQVATPPGEVMEALVVSETLHEYWTAIAG